MSDIALPIRERLLELSKQLESIANGADQSVMPTRLRHPMPGEERKPEWWMKQVRHIYAGRRLRERFLPAGFFGEAAWDILLELFMLDLYDQRATVKRACVAASVPPTTALRWIAILEDERLIIRSTSKGDHRVIWLSLTPKGIDTIRRYILALDALRDKPTPEMLLITGGRSE